MRSFVPESVTIDRHGADAPNRALLAVHAAVGNILHASGHGTLIDETLCHLKYEPGATDLRRDGSTDLEELLSVTGLALLATNPSLPFLVSDGDLASSSEGFDDTIAKSRVQASLAL